MNNIAKPLKRLRISEIKRIIKAYEKSGFSVEIKYNIDGTISFTPHINHFTKPKNNTVDPRRLVI